MSEPIRILHIVTTMDTGGVETLLMNLYRKIDRTKVQFDFLKHRQAHSYYDDEILKMGGRIFPGIPFNPLHMTQYRGFLRSFFQKHPEYQIVHAHTHYNTFALQEAMRCGVPVRIAHAHTAYPKIDKKYPFKLYNRLCVGKNCTHKMACANMAGRWFFGRKSVERDQVQILYNGIDTEEFRFSEEIREKTRGELGLKDELTLIHVGRFEQPKNHVFLLDLFAELLKKRPEAVLLLVGDGTLRKAMEQKTKKLGICGSVRFLGVRGDVSELLQAADLFVFPSLYEGLPVATIEAQAAGLPTFVSAGLPKEIQATSHLRFLDLNSGPKAWAETILATSEKQMSRADAWKEVEEAGFDISATAEELQSFYLQAIKKNGRN